MFSTVRLILGCVFLGFSTAIIKKSKTSYKHALYFVFTIITALLIFILAFFPFENLFMSFNSPEEAYEYFNFGESNIVLVVEGNYCDFVVDRKNDSTDSHLIIPKTEDGWKIGVGINTKKIAQKHYNGITAIVYQYKNSSDYFITIIDSTEGESMITDDYNTSFYSLERNINSINEPLIVYYAYIPNFNSNYTVTVRGNQISF